MEYDVKFEQTYEYVWGERISDKVLTNEFLSENQDFVNEVTCEIVKAESNGFKVDEFTKVLEILVNLTKKYNVKYE